MNIILYLLNNVYENIVVLVFTVVYDIRVKSEIA